jgi:hypothetical protein
VLKEIIGFNKYIVFDILFLVLEMSIIKLLIQAFSKKYSWGKDKILINSFISEMCFLRMNTIVNKNKKQSSLE